MGEQVALVGLGHLLEHVGEPLVVQRVDHLVLALLGQLRAAPSRRRPAASSRRPTAAPRCPAGRRATARSTEAHGTTCTWPRRPRRPRRARTASATDDPVPGPGLLDGRVDHDRLRAGVGQPDRGVEQLADEQRLVGTLAEAAQAHRAGGQRDRAGVDRGDPQHRHEDPPAGGQLDDQAEHPRRAGVHPQGRDEVAHLADALAVRSEHGKADQPRHEHPCRAHGCSLGWS